MVKGRSDDRKYILAAIFIIVAFVSYYAFTQSQQANVAGKAYGTLTTEQAVAKYSQLFYGRTMNEDEFLSRFSYWVPDYFYPPAFPLPNRTDNFYAGIPDLCVNIADELYFSRIWQNDHLVVDCSSTNICQADQIVFNVFDPSILTDNDCFNFPQGCTNILANFAQYNNDYFYVLETDVVKEDGLRCLDIEHSGENYYTFDPSAFSKNYRNCNILDVYFSPEKASQYSPYCCEKYRQIGNIMNRFASAPLIGTDGSYSGYVTTGESVDYIFGGAYPANRNFSSEGVIKFEQLYPGIHTSTLIINGTSLGDSHDVLTSDDLPILETSTFNDVTGSNIQSTTYTQKLLMDPTRTGTEVYFNQDDVDMPNAGIYLHLDDPSDTWAYVYELEFAAPVKYDAVSNITAKNDLFGNTLRIMGRNYTITDAAISNGNLNKITIQRPYDSSDSSDVVTYVFENTQEANRYGKDIEGTKAVFNFDANGLWKGFSIYVQPEDDVYLKEGDTWADPVFEAFKFIMGSEHADREQIKMLRSGKKATLTFLNPDAKEVELNWYINTSNAIRLAFGDDMTSDRIYLQGETCRGATSVEDCEGARFLAIASNGIAHVIELKNIDVANNKIDFRDLTYDGINDNDNNYVDGAESAMAISGFGNVSLRINEAAKSLEIVWSGGNYPIKTKNNAVISPRDPTTSTILFSLTEGNGAGISVHGLADVINNEIDLNYFTDTGKSFGQKDASATDSDNKKEQTIWGTTIAYDSKDDDSVVMMYPKEKVYYDAYLALIYCTTAVDTVMDPNTLVSKDLVYVRCVFECQSSNCAHGQVKFELNNDVYKTGEQINCDERYNFLLGNNVPLFCNTSFEDMFRVVDFDGAPLVITTHLSEPDPLLQSTINNAISNEFGEPTRYELKALPSGEIYAEYNDNLYDSKGTIYVMDGYTSGDDDYFDKDVEIVTKKFYPDYTLQKTSFKKSDVYYRYSMAQECFVREDLLSVTENGETRTKLRLSWKSSDKLILIFLDNDQVSEDLLDKDISSLGYQFGSNTVSLLDNLIANEFGSYFSYPYPGSEIFTMYSIGYSDEWASLFVTTAAGTPEEQLRSLEDNLYLEQIDAKTFDYYNFETRKNYTVFMDVFIANPGQSDDPFASRNQPNMPINRVYWTSGDKTVSIYYLNPEKAWDAILETQNKTNIWDYNTFSKYLFDSYMKLYVPDEFGDISYTMKLESGWNLISVPLFVENNAIEDYFKDEMSGIDKVYAFENNEWQIWNKDPAVPSNLHKVLPGRAYFVKANAASTTTKQGLTYIKDVANPPTPITIKLEKGWNLVGPVSRTSTQKTTTVQDYLKYMAARVQSIWGYDQNQLIYVNTNTGSLDMTKGYWIYVSEAGEIPG